MYNIDALPLKYSISRLNLSKIILHLYIHIYNTYLFMFSFMISFHTAITPRRNSVSIYLFCVKSKQTDIIGKTSIVRRCYEINTKYNQKRSEGYLTIHEE